MGFDLRRRATLAAGDDFRGFAGEHAWAGKVEVIGLAVSLSATSPAVEPPAPMVGQHTEEILHALGVDEKTIVNLEARMVIEQAA